MKDVVKFFIYLLVMSGTTYLVRVIPFVLCRKEITNKRVKLFLNYVPYAVLSAMTVPAILYATASRISGLIGLLVACILGYCRRSLLMVAIGACAAVYATEFIMSLMGVL